MQLNILLLLVSRNVMVKDFFGIRECLHPRRHQKLYLHPQNACRHTSRMQKRLHISGRNGCKNKSAEEAHKAWMTVRFVVLLLEGTLVELAVTERADKVLRMVLAIHSRDTATCYRLVTASTQRPALSMKVRLTVRKPIVLKKVTVTEWHTTFLHDHTMAGG